MSVSQFLLNLLMLVLTVQGSRLKSRVVQTKQGALRGVILTFPDQKISPVEMFLGVPYALPPVGSLRFMPPVTAAPWRGIRTVDKFSAVCPQNFPSIDRVPLYRMPGARYLYLKKMKKLLEVASEDCLYVNIYAPARGK